MQAVMQKRHAHLLRVACPLCEGSCSHPAWSSTEKSVPRSHCTTIVPGGSESPTQPAHTPAVPSACRSMHPNHHSSCKTASTPTHSSCTTQPDLSESCTCTSTCNHAVPQALPSRTRGCCLRSPALQWTDLVPAACHGCGAPQRAARRPIYLGEQRPTLQYLSLEQHSPLLMSHLHTQFAWVGWQRQQAGRCRRARESLQSRGCEVTRAACRVPLVRQEIVTQGAASPYRLPE